MSTVFINHPLTCQSIPHHLMYTLMKCVASRHTYTSNPFTDVCVCFLFFKVICLVCMQRTSRIRFALCFGVEKSP